MLQCQNFRNKSFISAAHTFSNYLKRAFKLPKPKEKFTQHFDEFYLVLDIKSPIYNFF